MRRLKPQTKSHQAVGESGATPLAGPTVGTRNTASRGTLTVLSGSPYTSAGAGPCPPTTAFTNSSRGPCHQLHDVDSSVTGPSQPLGATERLDIIVTGGAETAGQWVWTASRENHFLLHCHFPSPRDCLKRETLLGRSSWPPLTAASSYGKTVFQISKPTRSSGGHFLNHPLGKRRREKREVVD